MTIKEVIEILKKVEDQDAEVYVVAHKCGTGYYDQGGTVSEELFNPDKHLTYTDFRNNPFVKDSTPLKNKRELLIGSTNN